MSNTPNQYDLASQVSAFLEQLLMEPNRQEIPAELSSVEGFNRLCAYLYTVKDIISNFSRGKFDGEVELRGSTAGYLKTLQSHIRHLVWQCKAVADGDLDQKVDCLGELSEAFNSMTRGLIRQKKVINSKQAELTRLMHNLEKEIKEKEVIAKALKTSEALYREKSWRDSPTGLYNRGYFLEAVSHKIEQIKRKREGYFCLMMMDLDHFKKINDTYGHLMGDKIVQIVATTLTTTLRKSDISCRYGGEEFAVFLFSTTLEQGKHTAEKIRLNIQNTPPPAENVTVPVTISIGLSFVDAAFIASHAKADDALMQAMEAADSALYVAKQTGRNQVMVSPALVL